MGDGSAGLLQPQDLIDEIYIAFKAFYGWS